jgi:hypothetical protein
MICGCQLSYLLEGGFGQRVRQSSPLPNICEEVPAAAELNDEQKTGVGVEGLVKPDDVAML